MAVRTGGSIASRMASFGGCVQFLALLFIVLSVSVSSSGPVNGAALRNQNVLDIGKYRKFEQLNQNVKKQKDKIKALQIKAARFNMQYSMNGTRFCSNSLPYPNEFLSTTSFTEGVVVSAEERKGLVKCSFLGAVCSTEATEHSLVEKYLTASDTVLETGARFGTTSCAIAHTLHNSGRLVSVEPDHRVWNLLDENRRTHKCNFWLLRGVIGSQPAEISGTFYSTRSVSKSENAKKNANGSSVSKSGSNAYMNGLACGPQPDKDAVVLSKPFYTFEDIQSTTHLKFTALLIDCEGCIETMFSNATSLASQLSNVHTIILEADMPIGAEDCTHDCVDYSKWVANFASIGLKVVYKEQDPVYGKIYHYVFKRGSS